MKKKEYKKPEMQVVKITSCTLLAASTMQQGKGDTVDQNWKKTGIMVINSHYNA